MTLKKTAVWALLALLFATQTYPLLWLLIYSFKTNNEIMSGAFFSLPKAMQWSNYENAFVTGHFLRYLMNSVLVTSVTLLAALALGTMLSYAISRFEWKGAKWVLLLFIVGIMIPMQATLLPLVVLFRKIHVLDTYFAMILPYVAFSLPLAVFILSGFFKALPRELEESATIDGASIYMTFRSVILPVTVPPIMTVTIVTFITIWNEYIMASTFISSIQLKTLPFGVYSFVGKYTTNYGVIGAYLVMAVIPVVLVYFLLAEKITKGMVAGAVKG